MIDRIEAQIEARLSGSSTEFLSLSRLADELGCSAFTLLDMSEQHWQLSPRAIARKKLEERAGSLDDCPAIQPLSAQSQAERLNHIAIRDAKARAISAHKNLDYAYGQDELGFILIAASERGLVFLSFGADKAALQAELEHNFPQATLKQAQDKLATTLKICLRATKGEIEDLDLPLDVQAPAFHAQVWAELLGIGFGAIKSYSQIAKDLGKPKAARAVGQACAKNQVSLMIPCHRCLTQAGGFGGYRWGLERKRHLLAVEGQQF